MDLKVRVLSAIRWTASVRFLGQLISWSMTIVVIRLLTPADYGLMAMATVFIAFLSIVDDLGLGAVLIQVRKLDTNLIRQIFTLLFLANLFFLIILFFGSPAIAAFFEEPRLTPITQVLSLRFLLGPFTLIPESLMERELDLKRRSIVDFASALIGAVITVALAYSGWQVWALVWGNIATALSRTIGLNAISPCLHYRLTFSFSGIRTSITFGGQVALERLLWFFYSQSDVFIAGKLLGKDILGFYKVAMHIASLPMEKISGLTNQIALPAFSRIQSSPDKVASYFLKAIRVMSFISFPLMWGISCVSVEMVVIFLGETWRPAALPLQILSLVIPLRMLSNLIPSVVQGVGRPEVAVTNLLIPSVVMPLAFLIGSQWGLLGISLAWGITFPMVFLIILKRTLPILGISSLEFLRAVGTTVLSSAGMYAVVTTERIILSGQVNTFWLLIIMITSGASVYSALMWTIHREGCREILGLVRL